MKRYKLAGFATMRKFMAAWVTILVVGLCAMSMALAAGTGTHGSDSELPGRVDSVVLVNAEGKASEEFNGTTLQNVNVQVSLTPDQGVTENVTSAYLGYEITVPKTTATGGKVGMGGFTFLTNLNGSNSPAQVVTEGNNLVIRGKQLVKASPSVLSAMFENVFQVSVSGANTGDEVKVQAKAWLIKGIPAQPAEGTYTMTSKNTVCFDLMANNTSNQAPNPARQAYGGPTAMAYYNRKTHEISPFGQTGPDWVYGRIYTSRFAVFTKPPQGTERLDPSKPITWKVTSMVTTGKGVEDLDPDHQPILLGMKAANPQAPVGAGVLDNLSLLGLVNQENLGYWFYAPFYGPGVDYRFTSNDPNGTDVDVKVVLGDSRLAPYNSALIYGQYFVPIPESDTASTNRHLILKSSDLHLTAMSGVEYGDCDPNDNAYDFQVAPRPKFVPSQLQVGAYYNGNTYVTDGSEKVLYYNVFFQPTKDGVDKWGKVLVPAYSINALNVLLKRSPGIVKFGSYNTSYTYVDPKTGNGVEPNHLYAVKPDGKDWTSLKEMGDTRDWQLRYYDSLEEAERHGVVVAELYEFRGGMFLTPVTFGNRSRFTGNQNALLAFTTEARSWQGDHKLTAADSWKGTNGAKVEEDTFNGTRIDHSQLAIPGPPPTAPVNSTPDTTWGALALVTAKMNNDYKSSAQLDGSNRSVWFSMGDKYPQGGTAYADFEALTDDNQRYVDSKYTFSVEKYGKKNLNLSLAFTSPLDNPAMANRYPNGTTNYRVLVDQVYLSTKDHPVTYTPGETGGRGTIQGGIKIDPKNFQVPGDGDYQIYFTTYLGDAEDLSKDIKPLQFVCVSPTLSVAKADEKECVNATSPTYFVARVLKAAQISVNKTAVNQAMTNMAQWQIETSSLSTAVSNYYLLDILPHNHDGRKSSFHGTYQVADGFVRYRVTGESGAGKSQFQLYYTADSFGDMTETSYLGKLTGCKVADLEDGFQVEGITWHKAQAATDKDGKSGWQVPARLDGKTITGLMWAAPTFYQNERLALGFSLKTQGSWRGDVYVNEASAGFRDTVLSSAASPVRVIDRRISGTAWEGNNDTSGLAAKGTRRLSGIRVTLHKQDGTPITTSMDGNEYHVVTDSNGKYRFDAVPYEEDGYYVSFEGGPLKGDLPYPIGPGPIGSQADANYCELVDGVYRTQVFKMKSDEDLITSRNPLDLQGNVNLGVNAQVNQLIVTTESGFLAGQPLEGAHYTLYMDEACTKEMPFYADMVSDEQGKVCFNFLEPGTYWLKEIKAPDHYESVGVVKITITNEPDQGVTCTSSKGQVTGITRESNRNAISLTLKNGYAVPVTGLTSLEKPAAALVILVLAVGAFGAYRRLTRNPRQS